jgi:hypothetical protein
MTQFPSQFRPSQLLQPNIKDGAGVPEYHMLLFYEDELDVGKSQCMKHVTSAQIPVQDDYNSTTWSSQSLSKS